MDSVNPIQSVLPPSAVDSDRRSDNQLAQEDFLKLMVAQLENQDPSNPVDNGDFLAQIAQFSMVEGISGMEEGFQQLAETLQRNEIADAASLLGKDVLFDGSVVQLAAGSVVEGQVMLTTPATGAQLKVLDANGVTVASKSLGTLAEGGQTFSWDGTGLDGNPVPEGTYSIAITGSVGGAPASLPVQLYGRVDSVGVDPLTRDVSLQLGNGLSMGLNDIYEFK